MNVSVIKKALIIGGGFSGMSAAIAFAKRGIDVHLVEISKEWRAYGAGISIASPTLRAFKTLGVLPRYLERGAAFEGCDLFTAKGELIAHLSTPCAGTDIPAAGAIMRPALAEILAAATLAAGVTVHLDCTFSELVQDDQGVNVSFTDGRNDRYDLVVGADGLNSCVREQVFPEAPQPSYCGQGVWRAVIARPPEVDRTKMWVGPHAKAGVNPVSSTQMYLFVNENREKNERIPAGRQLPMLREILSPFTGPIICQAREQLDENAQVLFRPLEHMLMPTPWFKGRVVLMGDAIHATTPHLASGACIGIEDAIVLAEELERATGLTDALESFQARRWERCRMVVENSARLGEIEIADGDKAEHARIMRESMMALAEPI